MRTANCSLGSLNKYNDDKFKDMGYGDGTNDTREFAARGLDGDAIISIKLHTLATPRLASDTAHERTV